MTCLVWSSFVLIIATLVSAQNEEIKERIALKLQIQNGNPCRMYDVMTVGLTRQNEAEMNFYLRAHDLIGASSGSIYDQVQEMHLEQKVVTKMSYLDEENGGAFVARCVEERLVGKVIKLEGSIHILGRQYRISPSEIWARSLVRSRSHVTGQYLMEPLTPPWPRPHTKVQSEALDFARKEKDENKDYNQLNRQKRQISTYNIDVLPVVDFKLYQKWLGIENGDPVKAVSSIQSYVEQMFTSVALRMKTLDLGQKSIAIRIVEPYVAQTQATSPLQTDIEEWSNSGQVTISAVQALKDLKTWVQNHPNLDANDHVMLLTGYTIHGTIDMGQNFNVTKGLANVGTICKNGDSGSVVEERAAYQSESVAAHELGHSLGSLHDGSENLCKSSDRYVMSDSFGHIRTADNVLNPWKFSSCSSQTIAQHLATVESDQTLNTCLTQIAGKEVRATKLHNPNDLCTAFYGQESFVCRGVGIPGLTQMCEQLYCREPGTDTCVLMDSPTGTCCGNGFGCKSGVCTLLLDSSSCQMDENCPFGDQPGVVVNGLECSQIPSYLCYEEDVKAKCCDTCARKKINENGCYYGDKLSSGCDDQYCGTTFGAGMGYSFMCCQTCKNIECSDKSTLTVGDLTYSCAEFLNKFGKSWCYNNTIHDEACCRTCEEFRDKSNDECQFGDNLVKKNCPMLLQLGRECTPQQEIECCETCKKIREATTSTTSTTPTTPTTKPDNNNNKEDCTGPLCGACALQVTLGLLLASVVVSNWL